MVRQKQSKTKRGKKSHMAGKTWEEIYGMERAKELKQKSICRVSPNKGKTYEEMYGIERAGELRQKNGDIHRGLISHKKGKTYEELYGVEHANVLKQKNSDNHLGNKHNEETKIQMSKSRTGRVPSEETKEKLRESRIQYLNEHGGCVPCVGKHETQILDELEKLFGMEIKRNFKVIGYFIDGYISELNVCIEIDEKHHFNFDGSRTKKDTQRQKNIEKKLNCKFIRIKVG